MSPKIVYLHERYPERFVSETDKDAIRIGIATEETQAKVREQVARFGKDEGYLYIARLISIVVRGGRIFRSDMLDSGQVPYNYHIHIEKQTIEELDLLKGILDAIIKEKSGNLFVTKQLKLIRDDILRELKKKKTA